MEENIKVVTLNCWGVFVPTATVRKNDRMKAISETLSKQMYDIVFLQEVWTDCDYNHLVTALKSAYPYSNYFHSNFIGSGLCIFSRWSIELIFTHAYGANGYPHRLKQGDWYCGKGIGFARVISPKGFRLHLYDTHLHARYALDPVLDNFEGHRSSQALEIIEFIRSTASGADAIFIAGDFNFEPNTSTIRLIKSILAVSDAWLDNESVDKNKPVSALELEGCTCDRADNPYSNTVWTKAYINGERLDYIFYRTGDERSQGTTKVTCKSCWLDLREVPGDANGLHYSDHEAVAAHFVLTRVDPSTQDEPATKITTAPESTEQLLLETRQRLQRGLSRCYKGRRQHGLWLLLLTLVIFSSMALVAACGQGFISFTIMISAVLGGIWFMLFWGTVVGRTAERRALQNAENTVDILLSQINKANVGDTAAHHKLA